MDWVPKSVRFAIKHQPRSLKSQRAKWEAVFKLLPKQVAPYLMLAQHTVTGFREGRREGALLAKAWASLPRGSSSLSPVRRTTSKAWRRSRQSTTRSMMSWTTGTRRWSVRSGEGRLQLNEFVPASCRSGNYLIDVRGQQVAFSHQGRGCSRYLREKVFT